MKFALKFSFVLVFPLFCKFTLCQDVYSNNILKVSTKNFKLYWNVPTFQCRSHKVYFVDLAQKYGIVQNQNDDFRGDQISILYDPGAFPAILTVDNSENVFSRFLSKSDDILLRNGGVPQEGNISFHLELYKEKVEELIPDKKFNGISVIDFESWRPIFRQNFGVLIPYKQLSVKIEKDRHPSWPDNLVEKEAMRRFESSGRKFMEETLKLSKELRPFAKWGYYAYPYCFNMSPRNMNTQCSSEVQKENDRTQWLFSASDAFYPSLYMPENRLKANQRINMIEGRIAESKRVGKTMSKVHDIIPYFWFKYQDSKKFLSKEDLKKSFEKLKSLGINEIVLWGSSNDVSSKAKCEDLYDYVDTVLGPTWINVRN